MRVCAVPVDPHRAAASCARSACLRLLICVVAACSLQTNEPAAALSID
jgi:hypothetical protein